MSTRFARAIHRWLRSAATARAYKRASRSRTKYDYELSLTQALGTLGYEDTYHYMLHYFHNRAPRFVLEHRRYFGDSGRGFGEDAFHAMWWLLWLEFRPTMALEIGVFRGQVISLWALLSKVLHMDCAVHGISPLTSLGDTVSSYDHSIDYESDIRGSFRNFGLDPPVLVRSLSTDPPALSHIREHEWDLAYIDGSHDFDVVLQDYFNCRDALRAGGLLVLDDAAERLEGDLPPFAFKGHPGPSRVASEHAMNEMEFLGAVGHNLIFQKRGE